MGSGPRWRWSDHQVAQEFIGLARPEQEWNRWESNKQLFQGQAGTRDHMKCHACAVESRPWRAWRLRPQTVGAVSGRWGIFRMSHLCVHQSLVAIHGL